MSGKTLPMLPFFVRDYVTATRHLSLAERGAFTDLLWFQWEHGVLPSEPARIARLLGCSSEEFAEVWPAIREKFEPLEGGLANQRLEQHRQRALELSAIRAAVGREGGRARRTRRNTAEAIAKPIASAIAQANDTAKSNHPSPSPSPSPNPSPEPSRGVLEDSHSSEDREADSRALLQNIRAFYPVGIYRKADWLLAEREIRQRLEEGEEPSVIVSGCARYRQQAEARGNLGTQYVTAPSRFFRERQYLEPFPLPAVKETATAQLLSRLRPEPVRTWEPPDDTPEINP